MFDKNLKIKNFKICKKFWQIKGCFLTETAYFYLEASSDLFW